MLVQAYARMVRNLKSASANVDEAIALGDLNVNIADPVENDSLGIAFSRMVDNLKILNWTR